MTTRYTALLLVTSLGAALLVAHDTTAQNTPPSNAAASSAGAKPASARLPRDATVDAYVASMRSDLSKGKVGIITDVMHLSDGEAKVFWPIYSQYESDLFELGDQRVDGIRRFAAAQQKGALSNDDATQLSSAYFDFEGKRLELLKRYHEEIARELSPVRAAQFTQIEHRVGTVTDLIIASELPLIGPTQAAAR